MGVAAPRWDEGESLLTKLRDGGDGGGWTGEGRWFGMFVRDRYE
jgi:hypothetical protein